MSRRLALALLVLASAACGQESSAVPGTLVVDRYGFDFGTVGLGSRLEVPVRLRNPGGEALELERPELAPPFALDESFPRRLAAGEEVAIRIHYAPSAAGEHAATLALRWGRSRVAIALRGRAVERRLRCDDLDFGEVVAGASRSVDLTCENLTSFPIAATLGPPAGENAGSFQVSSSEVVFQPFSVRREPVTFTAGAAGKHEAMLPIVEPERGAILSVRLGGRSVESLLTLEPDASCTKGGWYLGVTGVGVPIERTLTLHNLGSALLEVHGLSFEDPDFATYPSGPVQLGPSGRLEVAVRFTPGEAGLRETFLVLDPQDPDSASTRICIRARAIGPAFACTPAELDFGEVARLDPQHRTLVCDVLERDPANGWFELEGVATTNEAFTATIRGERRQFATGEQFLVDVLWAASGALDKGAVVITADDPATPRLAIPVRGTTVAIPDCPLPAALDIGRTEPQTERILPWSITNGGAERCRLGALALADDAGGAFELVQTPAAGILEPHASVPFAAAYRPSAPGEHLGRLTMAGAEGGVDVALRGSAGEACLVAPELVELGVVPLGCRSREARIPLVNGCERTLRLGAPIATSSAEAFEVAPASALGELGPGESAEVSVAFQATEREATSWLRIPTEGGGDHVVPVLATAQSGSATVESYLLQEGTLELVLRGHAADRDEDGDVDSADLEISSGDVRLDPAAYAYDDAGRTVTFVEAALPPPGPHGLMLDVAYRVECR